MGGLALRRCCCGGFGHSLPSRHGVFGTSTLAVRTVGSVAASTGVTPSSDPLTVVSGVIAIPLRELYAVLWRLGVVEIDD
ncbi:Rv1535 domain-containing protein [Mycobacterium sp. SMC-4]|uniref:Rv1535 domain-containing protein n=1 Tax=Mycobacterium sp. SMC-4 TaxID=2857059 RepID=UPI0037CC09D1